MTDFVVNFLGGFLAGALASLLIEYAVPSWCRSNRTNQLIMAKEDPLSGFVRCSVTNGSDATIHNARLSISIPGLTRERVLHRVKDRTTTIRPDSMIQLKRMGLHWADMAPEEHPVTLDLYASESHTFNPFWIQSEGVWVASEISWMKEIDDKLLGRRTYYCRVMLSHGRYEGVLHFASDDTGGIDYAFTLDTSNCASAGDPGVEFELKRLTSMRSLRPGWMRREAKRR